MPKTATADDLRPTTDARRRRPPSIRQHHSVKEQGTFRAKSDVFSSAARRWVAANRGVSMERYIRSIDRRTKYLALTWRQLR